MHGYGVRVKLMCRSDYGVGYQNISSSTREHNFFVNKKTLTKNFVSIISILTNRTKYAGLLLNCSSAGLIKFAFFVEFWHCF